MGDSTTWILLNVVHLIAGHLLTIDVQSEGGVLDDLFTEHKDKVVPLTFLKLEVSHFNKDYCVFQFIVDMKRFVMNHFLEYVNGKSRTLWSYMKETV